jgi:hypothetical protein
MNKIPVFNKRFQMAESVPSEKTLISRLLKESR